MADNIYVQRDMFWTALRRSLDLDQHLRHLTNEEKDACASTMALEARALGKATMLKRVEFRAGPVHPAFTQDAFAQERRPRNSRVIKCPTDGCNGDGRYAAPGRGHRTGCHYPENAEDLEALDG